MVVSPSPPILSLGHDGKLTIAAMAGGITPKYLHDISAMIIGNKQNKEVVFAIDRYTKPGQGTKDKNVLQYFGGMVHTKRITAFDSGL